MRFWIGLAVLWVATSAALILGLRAAYSEPFVEAAPRLSGSVPVVCVSVNDTQDPWRVYFCSEDAQRLAGPGQFKARLSWGQGI